jgi:hypothetical protein
MTRIEPKEVLNGVHTLASHRHTAERVRKNSVSTRFAFGITVALVPAGGIDPSSIPTDVLAVVIGVAAAFFLPVAVAMRLVGEEESDAGSEPRAGRQLRTSPDRSEPDRAER